MRARAAGIVVALLAASCGGGRHAPAPPAAPSVVESRRVVATGVFSCAITDAGQVACWGGVPFGTQVQPALIPALDGALELASDGSFLCARRAHGVVHCIGRDVTGSRDADVPSLRGATSLGLTEDVRCAVVAGRVKCLGGYHWTPFDAGIDRAVELVSSGRSVVCARRDHAPTTCLYTDYRGAVRFEIVGSDGATVAFTPQHRPCALRDGTLRCIADFPGVPDPPETEAFVVRDAAPAVVPLGDAQSVPGATAVIGADWTSCTLRGAALECIAVAEGDPIPARLDGVTAFSLDASAACARRRDGAVLCWGRNDGGQSGPAPSAPDVATRVVGLPPATAVATRGGLSCALDRAGATWCWADRATWSVSPRIVPGVPALASLVGSEHATCGAARDGGAVHCICDRDGPTEVAFPWLDGSRELVNGLEDLVARGADGRVVETIACSGSVDGEPTPNTSDEAIRLAPLDGDGPLVGGWDVACALGPRLRCTGRPSGEGPDERALRPAAPWSGLAGATRAWARTSTGCAELDGAIRCFGSAAGLAPGSEALRPVPELGTDVAGLALDRDRLCAWSAAGDVRCAEGHGLHDVHGPTHVVAVAVSDTTCALTREGEVWCWGAPPRGDGRPSFLKEPTRIALP